MPQDTRLLQGAGHQSCQGINHLPHTTVNHRLDFRQGNFALNRDTEVMIVQTSHPSDFLWCSFGFYVPKADLEHSEPSDRYANVQCDLVDDA